MKLQRQYAKFFLFRSSHCHVTYLSRDSSIDKVRSRFFKCLFSGQSNSVPAINLRWFFQQLKWSHEIAMTLIVFFHSHTFTQRVLPIFFKDDDNPREGLLKMKGQQNERFSYLGTPHLLWVLNWKNLQVVNCKTTQLTYTQVRAVSCWLLSQSYITLVFWQHSPVWFWFVDSFLLVTAERIRRFWRQND